MTFWKVENKIDLAFFEKEIREKINITISASYSKKNTQI